MDKDLYDLQIQLAKALQDSADARKQYEDALANLEPLKVAAEQAEASVEVLMNSFQSATGRNRIRRGVFQQRKIYKIDPGMKVEAQYKRSLSRALNSGKTKAEAERVAEKSAAGLKAKLGL